MTGLQQFYYTSCEHGRDGIFGYQVNAATPGIPARIENEVLRASRYEAPPDLVRDTAAGLDAYPVTLGFIRLGDNAVLFQSRYVGEDFSGRVGNYFVHAVLVRELSDLGGHLPVDLWRSPSWVDRPVADPVLRPLPGVMPRTASAHATDLTRLPVLLGAVQRALATGRGRVTAVSRSDDDAQAWVAAISRSLPASIAWDVTFSTWSRRPAVAGVLLAFATPDCWVEAPNGGVVVDVSTDDARLPDLVTPYSTAVTQLWADGGDDRVASAMLWLESMHVTAAELDDAAEALSLLSGDPVGAASLAGGLGFLVRRGHILPQPSWDQVWSVVAWHLAHDAPLNTVTESLRIAEGPDLGVPAEVGLAYARRAATEFLADPEKLERIWLPRLSDQARMEVADIVLPYLLNSATPRPAPSRIEQFIAFAGPEWCGLLVSRLGLGKMDDESLVDHVPVEVARWYGRIMLPADADPGLERGLRLLRLTLARHRDLDPVEVLLTELRDRPGDDPVRSLDELIRIMWPGRIPPADAAQLIETLPADHVARTGIVASLVEELVQQATSGAIEREHEDVARIVVQRFRSQVPENWLVTFTLLGWGPRIRSGPLPPAEQDEVLDLILTHPRPPSGARQWLGALMSDEILGSGAPLDHLRFARRVLSRSSRELISAYAAQARNRLKTADETQRAEIVAVWLILAKQIGLGVYGEAVVRDLLHSTLPSVLGRREVSRIDEQLSYPGSRLLAPVRESQLPDHFLTASWERWREAHTRRGLQFPFGGKRRSRG